MSSDKNPEVAGCDASIMKNVWEIREREYGQKMQLEQERVEKSALISINQDWANRASAKLGPYKRKERKPKPAETQMDNNFWKGKQPQIPPALPRGVGSAPLGRPGSQSRGQGQKGQDKMFNRLQSLMFITQTQPSAMLWGKSWQYNKSLPIPAEGSTATTNWGQCWMFATQQPYTEAGKPWPNGPNTMDPHNLHLWKKPDYRVVESQELDLCLSTEEWQMSWRKPDKKNKKEDTSSVNGENVLKSGLFTFLVETQRHNEALCSSEWSESWRSTKPADQQDHSTVPDDVLMNESIAKKQDKDKEISSKWEESWKFINHHDCNKSKSSQKYHSPEWANAWRAAMVVSNNHKNSDLSMRQDHSDTHDDRSPQKESNLHNVTLVSHEQKCRDLYLHLCNEFEALDEWNESWQVTKNNSKPCEEIEKVLKTLPSKMEAQKVEENLKEQYSTSEKADPCYEQLKHTVIYHPKREFTHYKLLHEKHLENVQDAPEWRESWKTLKHRMRMERRRMRPDPSRPFRESEKGGDMKPEASEWKDSWKFTCQPMHQEPELWEQGWSTTPKIRADRVRDQNHFASVELLQNGQTGEQSWGESWRFSRNQEKSEHGQGKAQTAASHHPEASWAHKKYLRSLSDWQVAWMVSETEFHHDKPSLTQWMEAWRFAFHTEHCTEHVSRISSQRAKAKMSHSFDNLIFRERYPEKEWSDSWRAGPLLNHQPSHYGPSESSTAPQQHTTVNEHGFKWGMSFRLANPMPHVEQPWVESSPSPCHYAIIWSRGKNIQHNINTSFSNNPVTSKLWEKSHQFLQEASTHIKDKSKSKNPVDPRVIITKKTNTRRHLYSNIEKEKQSERKWTGCHLLGKTQPRPKRSSASVKKIKPVDEAKQKFLEEWAESWRLLDQPTGLKKQMTFKSLLGWDESWKFLLPPY